jgi:hypothetical protein
MINNNARDNLENAKILRNIENRYKQAMNKKYNKIDFLRDLNEFSGSGQIRSFYGAGDGYAVFGANHTNNRAGA